MVYLLCFSSRSLTRGLLTQHLTNWLIQHFTNCVVSKRCVNCLSRSSSFSSTKLQLGSTDMGCDGGTIPRRDEMVKLKKKAEKVRCH